MVASRDLICRFRQSKLSANANLDQAVFVSWNPYPARTFPRERSDGLDQFDPF
jgi:hypothetical protein